MKLLVATMLLLFLINNIQGDPDPHSIQVNLEVNLNSCNCCGKNNCGCCDQEVPHHHVPEDPIIPVTYKPTTTRTTTTEPTTTKTTTIEPTTTRTTTIEPTTTRTTTIEPTTTRTTTTEPTTTYCDTLRTTICLDGSRCHADATCLFGSSGYICRCNIGYAGDGADCGTDGDGDSWPDVDLDCCEVQDHCSADNCPVTPNSGQEDIDNDGIGDACDTIKKPPPTPPTDSCEPHKPPHNCPLVSDAWRTLDSDGDGYVDSCDNCPYVFNVDQDLDADGDRVGDACDTDLDADKDGVQDGIDNCIDVHNPDQSDVDADGLGDKCDDDADNDGIPNDTDNCKFVPNPGQEDTDNDKIGDVCKGDFDGDCVNDTDDICPEDPTIHNTNFDNFHIVKLDSSGASGQDPPVFVINNGGKEIIQLINSAPGLMFGTHYFHGVDFEGTFFIDTTSDDDYAGFIFGYENSKSFYVVMWKQKYQPYWEYGDGSDVIGKAGVQLKKVHSNTGPGEDLAYALWETSDTVDQVTLLWNDSSHIGWADKTAYRWQLIHRPHIGLIRFRFLEGSTVIADSGNIYDSGISGGYLGVYCDSQEKIIWSNLNYNCNNRTVPQEVYDALDSDKQAKSGVDHSKTWAGVVKKSRKIKKPIVVLTEPGQ